jgi:carbonic anhydrase
MASAYSMLQHTTECATNSVLSLLILGGHYDCGGVRACTKNLDHQPPLENWLRNIRDVYRLHRAELDAIDDPEARHRRLVEINVIEQCINLFKTGVVQRRRVQTFNDETFGFTQPRIHACVYDPKDGKLRQLQVDFKEYIKDLHGIYNLYKIGDKSGMLGASER